MDIPVSSTLGFIGIVLFGFGLFLVLAGLDIFTIQQVSVRKGPKTWGLGIGIVILGIVLLFPEISPSISNPDTASNQEIPENEVSQTTDETNNSQEEVNDDGTWKPVTFNIPNDGHWTQPTDTSYSATGGKADAFAWSEEIVEGDFTLQLDVESDFGNYGEGLVIIYGDGQTWSNGCLIFSINGYWQSIRIDTIYSDNDIIWLDNTERKLAKDKYTMTIEVEGDTANLYADDILVASTFLPTKANHSGKIGLVKYWESADVTYSNILLLNP